MRPRRLQKLVIYTLHRQAVYSLGEDWHKDALMSSSEVGAAIISRQEYPYAATVGTFDSADLQKTLTALTRRKKAIATGLLWRVAERELGLSVVSKKKAGELSTRAKVVLAYIQKKCPIYGGDDIQITTEWISYALNKNKVTGPTGTNVSIKVLAELIAANALVEYFPGSWVPSWGETAALGIFNHKYPTKPSKYSVVLFQEE